MHGAYKYKSSATFVCDVCRYLRRDKYKQNEKELHLNKKKKLGKHVFNVQNVQTTNHQSTYNDSWHSVKIVHPTRIIKTSSAGQPRLNFFVTDDGDKSTEKKKKTRNMKGSNIKNLNQ